MPDKKQQPPKKEKKPIIVSDKNDPRYKAYQDSLTAYNNDIKFDKEFKDIVLKSNSIEEYNKAKRKLDLKYPLNNIKPIKNNLSEEALTLAKNDKLGITGKDNMVFKKPTQPVILQEQQRQKQTAIKNTLQPGDLITPGNEIVASEEIKPIPRTPKAYKRQTGINKNFGGWDMTETVKDPSNFSARKGDWEKITPIYAMGGNIQQNNNMNNITTYNEGGPHETNPNGGIPVGTSPQGQMNTVEQGEARMGDMIYSNRIPLSQEAVEAVGLPRKFIGKTPGQIMSLIDKTFKDRNDSPSQNTKKDIADKVAQAQEMIKAQQEAMQTQSQEVPDMMNGEIPQGMEEFVQNQMMEGGELDPTMLQGPADALTSLALGNKDEALTKGIKGGLTLAGTAIGGPLGGMTAGLISDIGIGLMNKNKEKKAENRMIANNAKMYNSGITNDFSGGGKMYNGGGPVGFRKNPTIPNEDANTFNSSKLFKNQIGVPYATENQSSFSQKTNVPSSNVIMFNPNNTLSNQGETISLSPEQLKEQSNYSNPELAPTKAQVNWNNFKTKAGKFGEKAKEAYPHILRAAPIAMNVAELARLKRKGYDTVNPILNDTKFKPEYIDEKTGVNLANSEMNNTINAISQMGGSEGAMRADVRGAGLNKGKILSDFTEKAKARNIATDQFGQQFNNQNTEANIGRRVMAEDLTARNKGAYETNRSKLIGQLGTDIGRIGKEEVFKDIAENMTGYDWLGRYLKVNPKATKEEVIQAYEAEQKTKKNPFQNRPSIDTSPITAAYGGKMKFRKY